MTDVSKLPHDHAMTHKYKAATAGEIRDLLRAGKPREAYRRYNPIWNQGLDEVPTHLHGGLITHVLYGATTGGFLTAFLSNDLMEVIARADPVSLAHIHQLAIFVRNFTPTLCHGDRAAVKAWREEGGSLSIYYDDADLEDAP